MGIPHFGGERRSVWQLGFVLERNPASSQNLGNSHFWNPREYRCTPAPHTPTGNTFVKQSPGVKSSPEAVSGALKQSISRVKDHWFIPFWTPPSSSTRTDTLGFLDLNTTKPPSRKAKNRVHFCHAASNFPGVTLHLPVGVTLKCNS